MAADHTFREYANQDNVDDAYDDMQRGVFDDQDRANEATAATYERVASEILRRDGKAEWREWRAYRVAGGAILAVVILAIGLVWMAIRGQRVQAMVQVVQHDEEGHLVTIGVPMTLLDYQPQDGAVRNMLTTWVEKRHWRGEEESDVRARHDWRWLYLHTCGTARTQLDAAEKQEQPFKKSSKRVQVDVDSLPKTPDGYQVLWKATTTEKYNPQAQEVWWNTTFTVGRVAPRTISDATQNSLGLCVTWFDDEKRHDLNRH